MLLKIFILSRNDGILTLLSHPLNGVLSKSGIIRNLLRIGMAHRRYQTNLTNLIQQVLSLIDGTDSIPK